MVCIILDQERPEAQDEAVPEHRPRRRSNLRPPGVRGGRPCLTWVLTSPTGLFNSTVGFTSFSKSTTDMFAFECILCPGSLCTFPSTRTRPCDIKRSPSRRLDRPLRDMIFAGRSSKTLSPSSLAPRPVDDGDGDGDGEGGWCPASPRFGLGLGPPPPCLLPPGLGVPLARVARITATIAPRKK